MLPVRLRGRLPSSSLSTRKTPPTLMPIPAISPLVARVVGKASLRTVLIVPFVLQIVGTVGLVGYLSYRNGQEAVNNVASRYRQEVSDRIGQYLYSFLEKPHLLNQINANTIRLEKINLKNLKDREYLGHHLWQQLQVFDSARTCALVIETGEGVGVVRQVDATVDIFMKDATSILYQYQTDSQGNRIKLVRKNSNYDGRKLLWYEAAAQQGKATWSPIFIPKNPPIRLSIAAVLPWYDPKGNFQGVFGSALTFDDIHRFLEKLKISPSGKAFIIERSGLIVATSTSEQPFLTSADGKVFTRIQARNSRVPLIQSSAQYLTNKFSNLNQIKNSRQLEFTLKGQRQFLQITPLHDQYGLDLLLVVVVPESDFMEQIEANNRITILLCIAALLGSIGVGILTARWLTQPILRLNSAAKALAKGEWNKSIEIKRADELGELANSFKTMATHLQQSFAELQSLNQALAQRENQLRQFFEAIPVGVSIHEATGKVLYFNQTAKDLFGIATIPDAVPEDLTQTYQVYRQNQLYPTEELPSLRALKGETVFVDDIEFHRDGKIIPGEVRSTPIFDEQGNIIYAISAFADITQRKRTEKLLADYNQVLETQVAERTTELAIAKELRETIYNESTDAIFLVDPKTLQITDCNRRAVELFEVNGKEDLIGIQGRTLQRYPFTSAEIDEILAQLHEKGFWSREIEYLTRQEKVFWGNIAGKLVQIAGEEVNLVRITDISDRKQIEKQLRASLKEKEVLLREIYHRVKNNMQLVSSLLHLQASSINDPTVLRLLHESQQRVKTMALIHERLYRSQNLARVNVATYIQDLVNNLVRFYTTARSSIRVTLELADVELDLDRAVPCGLIINELVSNALKYAFPEQKGELYLQFCLEKTGNYCLIVKDDGIGIPAHIDPQCTDSLGMQLVYGLTEQLGGEIELDRSEGSQFRITFIKMP